MPLRQAPANRHPHEITLEAQSSARCKTNYRKANCISTPRLANDMQATSGTPFIDAVALPRTTRAVAAILRFAHEQSIPVTARGARYGYDVGGCVPVHGGIALSLVRTNCIKEINSSDFIAVVQPGVKTLKLQEAAEKVRLYDDPIQQAGPIAASEATLPPTQAGPKTS